MTRAEVVALCLMGGVVVGLLLVPLQPEPSGVIGAKFMCTHIGSARTSHVIHEPTGDITFLIDGQPDATVGCPVATSGHVDVSYRGCGTVDEILASVNRDGSDWRCWVTP